MDIYDKCYIDGQWVTPLSSKPFELVNPATEMPFATVSLAGVEDVDRAVKAARAAFPSFSTTSKAQRLEWLEKIIELLAERESEFEAAITVELGTPRSVKIHAGRVAGVVQTGRGDASRLRFRDGARRKHRATRADRCLRAHHGVELAAATHRDQALDGACCGLHGRR